MNTEYDRDYDDENDYYSYEEDEDFYIDPSYYDEEENDTWNWDDSDEEDYEDFGGSLVPNGVRPNGPLLSSSVKIEKELVLI